MYDRSTVVSAAVRAVLLQLRLGKSSYRQDILEQEGDRLIVSPLVGKDVQFETATVMVTGPQRGHGIYNVIIRMSTAEVMVEASCELSGDDYKLSLITSFVYVNSLWLSRRNVSVSRGDKLTPWGEPEGFDFESISATIVTPDIVLV